MRSILSFLFFSISLILLGQELPNTQLYLVKISSSSPGFKLEEIRWLSADNPNGYNNQPSLVNDAFYYTRRHPDSAQTDIYAFDLENGKKWPITRSVESEYSPGPTPGGNEFSCVRVERDGETQRLWTYPLDRSGEGEAVRLPYENIGYYQWKNEDQLALFLVEEAGNQLVTYDLDDNTEKIIDKGIDRSFFWENEGSLLYIDIFSDEFRYIKRFDPTQNEEASIVVRLPNDVRDFAPLPSGALLMGQKSRLMKYVPGKDVDWRVITDLGPYGLINITRILPIDENTFILVDLKVNGS